MIKRNFFFTLCMSALLLLSCGHDPLDVDASNEKFEGTFVDLHDVVFHADSITLLQKDRSFRKDMDEIYAYFRGYCLRIGDVKDTAFYNSIALFRADSVMQMIDKGISREFSNKKVIEATLADGFKHLKFHFKDGKQPKHIVYMNSVFSSSVFCTENEIGIGLERYLGPDDAVVKSLDPTSVFQWIKNGMRKEFLERDVIEGWVATHYVEENEGNLAEQMIRMGKVYYLVEAAFPDVEEHTILRYDLAQLNWAKENEYAFWKYLVDEKLLFETNERTNTNLLKPGPTSSGLPIDGSPDRMGCYLGWRMIHSYMDQNEITLKELLDVPYNKILNAYEIED